ncbi:hypothetical protein V2G26_003540 [Clonostachys chloroleuca]
MQPASHPFIVSQSHATRCTNDYPRRPLVTPPVCPIFGSHDFSAATHIQAPDSSQPKEPAVRTRLSPHLRTLCFGHTRTSRAIQATAWGPG